MPFYIKKKEKEKKNKRKKNYVLWMSDLAGTVTVSFIDSGAVDESGFLGVEV